MTRVSEPDENYDIQLAEGLSPEQRDEALRIFAGLRASRGIRDGHQGSPGVPVPLCPVPVDAAGTPCTGASSTIAGCVLGELRGGESAGDEVLGDGVDGAVRCVRVAAQDGQRVGGFQL
jgi:hypothetical protein